MRKHLFGYEKEKIGNASLRVMSLMFRVRDLFAPVETKVRGWGIKQAEKFHRPFSGKAACGFLRSFTACSPIPVTIREALSYE